MYTSKEQYYRIHSPFYNATRWAFLFGRTKLHNHIPDSATPQRILEIGCGTGYHLAQLEQRFPQAQLTGIDSSEAMLKIAKGKIHSEQTVFIKDRYTGDSFPENSFDLIICSYSLTMMNDLNNVIEAIKKHLCAEGMFMAVDFDQSPSLLFKQWMKTNFVDFDAGLFTKLKTSFPNYSYHTYQAYLGLWTYALFVGRS
ncbi:MAG: class I SAM-dependent methyltransferase [Balneolaceae bacterium]|nr:class I SAM-dependent methyltransferase [Balneolaceae bacterium]